MDINRFSIEALLFFFAANTLAQIAKFIYQIYLLPFPIYLILKLAILLVAIVTIIKLKKSAEIGEIILLSALTFIALG